jgi:hypothetical protein
MRIRAGRGLFVGAGAGRASIARIENHAGYQRAGCPVMPIDQEGPFIGVTMSGQDEIDSEVFEDRQQVLPHLLGNPFRIGVM